MDGRGTPLGVVLSGADRHDSMVLADALNAFPDVRSGKRGRPRRRLRTLHADKAWDSSERLGRYRWVVERTHVWMARFRRPTVRNEERDDIHLAFVTLGCALVYLRTRFIT